MTVALAWGLTLFSHAAIGFPRAMAAAAAAAVATIAALRVRSSDHGAAGPATVYGIVIASLTGGIVLWALHWLTGGTALRPAAEGVVASVALVTAFRWHFGRWLKRRRADGRFLRSLLLVGANDDAASLWHAISEEPELGFRVVAIAGHGALDGRWSGIPRRPSTDDVEALAEQVGADGFLVVGSAFGEDERLRILGLCLASGLEVLFYTGLAGVGPRRLHTMSLSGLHMVHVRPHVPSRYQLAAKRAIDVLGSAVLLPLVSPVLVAAAILIRLEDGGRVIYRHRVVGRFGHEIEVLKLRTMVPEASRMLGDLAAINERTGGPLFKSSQDPRITRVGRVLRATSIDELPQLWNVLRGQMSLVGPRFALPAEAAHFDEDHRRRTVMRPGITGLWQTEARDNPSFGAYRRLDLLYVDNWSLRMDLAILANTAHEVVVRAGHAIRAAGRAGAVLPGGPGTEPPRTLETPEVDPCR